MWGAILGMGLLVVAPTAAADPYAAARKRLVQEILIPQGITHPGVLRAMARTPRHAFVAPRDRDRAYYDMSLPIGHGQTITPPFLVALMTQELDPKPTDRVLEIGTGCGYQAAVLSSLVKMVYTIEIIEPLGKQAQARLQKLGYDNVRVKIGDGFQGWPEHAPFDKIIVTCSPSDIPQPLIQQLKENGRMVIPVGRRYQQSLYVLRKANGKMEVESIRPTLFVPMTGRAERDRRETIDPARPRLVNGGFESDPFGNTSSRFIPGWFYQRRTELITDPESAPEGRRYVCFRNRTLGRPSHVLQALALDGRRVPRIVLSARVAVQGVSGGPRGEARPGLGITFYDDQRAQIATVTLGPFTGTHSWQRVAKTIRVPIRAREAIVRAGLFGATGRMCVDDVRLDVAR